MMWLQKIPTVRGNFIMGLWHHPQAPRVIKAVMDYDPYVKYAVWLLDKKPENPYFPRIYDVFFEEGFAYVETELFEEVGPNRDHLIDICPVMDRFVAYGAKPETPFEPDLLEALTLLRTEVVEPLHLSSDIHTFNIMQRVKNKHWVLNDPVW